VVDAYIYMFFVGSGLATGFALVGLITWKIVKRSIDKTPKKRGIV
jgi:hypothetical protein